MRRQRFFQLRCRAERSAAHARTFLRMILCRRSRRSADEAPPAAAWTEQAARGVSAQGDLTRSSAVLAACSRSLSPAKELRSAITMHL